MNGRKVLVKPYYTLEETFQRLRKAVDISDVGDLHILSQDGKIELSLLCNDQIILINKKYAKPIEIKWPQSFGSFNVDGLVNFEVYDHGEIGELFRGLERENWLICNMPIEQPINDVLYETKVPSAVSFSSIGFCDEISVLSPTNLSSDKDAEETVTFFGSDWQLSSEMDGNPKKLMVVDIGGDQYYVCRVVKGSPLTKGMEITFHKQEQKPVAQLYAVFSSDSFEVKDYVVTKEAIQRFEQEYIGHNGPDQFNADGKLKAIQARRTEFLDSVIETEGLETLIALGRKELWGLLNKRKPTLFPAQTEKSRETINSFFKNQDLILFKRGRRKSK